MRRVILTLLLTIVALASLHAQNTNQKTIDAAKALAPISIEESALKDLQAIANEAAIVRQAAEVAKQLLTDKSSTCFSQSLNILEEAALSRENRREAAILSYRYLNKIPPEYSTDLRTGRFVPPKKP